ncbi:MAG: hypothetical protein ACI87E_004473 [Mariniblastus sp.]|jgi:hypothetical protein
MAETLDGLSRLLRDLIPLPARLKISIYPRTL